MNGIRTAKLTGNTLTGYLLDGGNVVAELEDDALSTSYLRGANLISRTTAATEYYTFNAHGDVVGLVNAAGTQTKTYAYDACGNEKDRIGADTNPFRYCGEYFDVESGIYYLRARYYDPSIGRFTQEDPAQDGLNWYSYTGGNPVLFIDPTGFQHVCVDVGGSSKPAPKPPKKDTAVERKRAHDEEKARSIYEENMKEKQNHVEKTATSINGIVDQSASQSETIVDISEWLDQLMEDNYTEFLNYIHEYGETKATLYFLEKVRTGGEWDLKNQETLQALKGKKLIYHGQEMRFDDPGNIHFGYISHLLFSDTFALMGAGLYQIISGTSSWEYWYSFFDDPRDAMMIQIGYNFAENNHPKKPLYPNWGEK